MSESCPRCDAPFIRHLGTEETTVGYLSPPGHEHNANCLSRTYVCSKGHHTVISQRRTCPACDWEGRPTCWCHPGDKVEEWPQLGQGKAMMDIKEQWRLMDIVREFWRRAMLASGQSPAAAEEIADALQSRDNACAYDPFGAILEIHSPMLPRPLRAHLSTCHVGEAILIRPGWSMPIWEITSMDQLDAIITRSGDWTLDKTQRLYRGK